jgi:hypothetical protein
MRLHQGYLSVVNEDSARTVNVRRVGSDGSVVAPTTLKYRLDCRSTGTVLVDWTSVTPAATTQILVTADQNRIINDCNEAEAKVLTAMADEGLSTQDSQEYGWQVVNLYGAGR